MGTFPQYDHPMAIKKYVRAAEAIGVSGNSDQEKVEGLIRRVDELKEQLEIKHNFARLWSYRRAILGNIG